jgi:hypothetical protein
MVNSRGKAPGVVLRSRFVLGRFAIATTEDRRTRTTTKDEEDFGAPCVSLSAGLKRYQLATIGRTNRKKIKSNDQLVSFVADRPSSL